MLSHRSAHTLASLSLLALLGCAQQPQETAPPPRPTTSTGTTTTVTSTDSTHTGETGTTSTVTTTYDCTTPWPTSNGVSSVGQIPSSEDFDITEDGYLIHVENGNLVKRSKSGQDTILVSPNVTQNAAGTRVLKNGDIAVSDVNSGLLVLVDVLTGVKTTLLSANWPNGIDVDADDNIYIADFADQGWVRRINAYNPADTEVLATGLYRPNGLALSPDGQTLYVAANWQNELWAFDRQADGSWGEIRLFHSDPGAAQSVTTDVCGAVYWESGAQVWRKSADGLEGGGVVNGQNGYFPNLRFGNDVGGFRRDALYGLSNNQLYEFDVGIPGKKHISIQ